MTSNCRPLSRSTPTTRVCLARVAPPGDDVVAAERRVAERAVRALDRGDLLGDLAGGDVADLVVVAEPRHHRVAFGVEVPLAGEPADVGGLAVLRDERAAERRLLRAGRGDHEPAAGDPFERPHVVDGDADQGDRLVAVDEHSPGQVDGDRTGLLVAGAGRPGAAPRGAAGVLAGAAGAAGAETGGGGEGAARDAGDGSGGDGDGGDAVHVRSPVCRCPATSDAASGRLVRSTSRSPWVP